MFNSDIVDSLPTSSACMEYFIAKKSQCLKVTSLYFTTSQSIQSLFSYAGSSIDLLNQGGTPGDRSLLTNMHAHFSNNLTERADGVPITSFQQLEYVAYLVSQVQVLLCLHYRPLNLMSRRLYMHC